MLMAITEPVKVALNISEAPVTILRLVAAIYPTGAWARIPQPLIPPGEFEESWQLRSGLSSWAWRAIGELKDNGALGDVALLKGHLLTIFSSHSSRHLWTRHPSAARGAYPFLCPALSDATAGAGLR